MILLCEHPAAAGGAKVENLLLVSCARPFPYLVTFSGITIQLDSSQCPIG